jgi:hypothetical protein
MTDSLTVGWRALCGRARRGGFEGHADAGFGEELSGVRADDVNAEDLVVFLFSATILRKPSVSPGCGPCPTPRTGICRPLRHSRPLSLLLRSGRRCDLGVAVGAVRDEVVFDRLDLFAGDLFNDQDASL